MKFDKIAEMLGEGRDEAEILTFDFLDEVKEYAEKHGIALDEEFSEWYGEAARCVEMAGEGM